MLYTGTVSPANEWGYEVAVAAGKVTAVSANKPGMAIPAGGFVLSGHGSSADWLVANAPMGATVTSPVSGPPPPPPPGPPAPCSAGYMRLTFDDGPTRDTTTQILNTLKARNIKATFFVVGEAIEAWPQGIQLEKADGHRVANHTYNHPALTTLTAAEVALQFSRTSDLIARYTGSRPTEWRPPYEDWNVSVRDTATSQGMSMVLWDYPTDSNDWQGLTPQQITDRILAGAFNGATILMHDRIQNSATALPGLLDELTTRGYCFN